MRRWLIGAVAISCLALAGCGGRAQLDANATKVATVSLAKSDSVKAHVYIDGTSSMYGYVNYGGGTAYTDAIRNIERTVNETWSKETITYSKFGDAITNLSRSQYLEMDKTAFYGELDTSLQKVVQQTNPGELNILVSDLFQTNQDLDSLVLALKSKYLGADQAVAIIGIKSQFNGKVFDVGKNLSSLTYASSSNKDSYRPFYVLVFGKANDVRAFTKRYTDIEKGLAPVKVAFISKYIGGDTKLSAGKLDVKAKKENKATAMATMSNLAPDTGAMQYRLDLDNKVSMANINMVSKGILGNIPDAYQLKISKLEYGTVKADGGSGITSIFKKGNKDVNLEAITNNQFITGQVASTKVDGDTATIDLSVLLKPSSSSIKKGMYRLNYALIPQKDAYVKAVDVFEDWSITDGQIGGNPADLQRVGNKTLNIGQFITTLASINYEINEPGFYDNYIYFEAK